MLSFFRINDPYRLFGLLIITITVSVFFLIDPPIILLSEVKSLVLGEAFFDGKLMYTQIFDDTPPLASALFGLMDALFDRSIPARHIVVIALLFFQAVYFGVQLIHNKAYNENTYLPSLIFGVLCFFSFDLIVFSAEILGSTLLLFALNKMYSLLEFKMQRDEIVLKLGVYLGLATFIIFSYWIFFIGCLIILITFTRLQFRRGALLVFGFLLPHLLLTTYYYYIGSLDLLWLNFYKSNLSLSGSALISNRSMLMLGAIPIGYFLFSIIIMNRHARLTKYQLQITQVMLLWLVIAYLHIVITKQVTPSGFITFIPSFAYFISYYLLLIRRKWIAELMLWTFLIGIISISLLSKYGKIEAINYSKLYPEETPHESAIKNKSVMILGSSFSLYRYNTLGGYFLNWELSAPVLSDVSNYTNVEIIASSFENDPPEMIVDEHRMIQKIFDRIPSLKLRYKKEGNYYRRVMR